MVRNVEPIGESVRITLPQQITQQIFTMLDRQVNDAIGQGTTMVELLGGNVQIIDSAGLNWLLATRGRLESAGSGFKLVDPSPVMADIFVATRLDSRFEIQYSGGGRNA